MAVQCNIGIKISFDGQEENLKEEAEYKLRPNGVYLWKKAIYHGSTKKQYYTQNLSDGCDLELWT